MEEARYWVLDSHPYLITVSGKPEPYAGLVDETKGGVVAWGSYENIVELAGLLNTIEEGAPENG